MYNHHQKEYNRARCQNPSFLCNLLGPNVQMICSTDPRNRTRYFIAPDCGGNHQATATLSIQNISVKGYRLNNKTPMTNFPYSINFLTALHTSHCLHPNVLQIFFNFTRQSHSLLGLVHVVSGSLKIWNFFPHPSNQRCIS